MKTNTKTKVTGPKNQPQEKSYWIISPILQKVSTLVLISVSVFLMYLAFQPKPEPVDNGQISSLDFSIPEKVEAQVVISEDGENGNIGIGISDTRDNASTQIALSKASTTTSNIDSTGIWYATDYEPTEIRPGVYEVKNGDTLWEIAEAVYGQGTEWTKIRDENSSEIGMLPSGEQALIGVGQYLEIPK